MISKKDIYYGVKDKEILLKKGFELWECAGTLSCQKGYTFIEYLYRSSNNVPLYSPFISEEKAKKLGII